MIKNRHITTNGIILKINTSCETDKNFIFISPDLGMQNATAYGGVKHKSRFCSSIQPFVSAKLFLYKSPKSSYFKIEDLTDLKSNDFINSKLDYIYLSSFYADVLLNSYLSLEEFKNYYFLLLYSLEILKKNNDIYKSFLFFTSKYIFLSGYHLCLDKCNKCNNEFDNYYFNFTDGGNFCGQHAKNKNFLLNKDSSKLWLEFLEKKYIYLKDIKIDKKSFNILLPVINYIIKYIFEKELKTFKFIKNIF